MRKKPTICILSQDVKASVFADCWQRRYPALVEIFSRGTGDQLVLAGLEEAKMVFRYAALLRADAELRFPYWSEDSQFYNEAHEDDYHDVQMGDMYHLMNAVMAEFGNDITTAIDPATNI